MITMMRLRPLLVTSLCVVLCLPDLAKSQSAVSAVLRVNQSVITHYELEQRIRFLKVINTSGNIRQIARDQLINDRLKNSLADEMILKLPEGRLGQSMTEFAASGELQLLSPERIWTECCKALETASPQVFFQILIDCDALTPCFSDLATTINSIATERLRKTADAGLSLTQRWTALCADADPSAIKQSGTQLKVPNKFLEAADLACRFWPLTRPDNSEIMLRNLQQFDWLRRPQRLSDFLQLAEVLGSDGATIQIWRDCADAASRIDAAALQASGLKGAEIGRELQHRRQQAIQQCLAA